MKITPFLGVLISMASLAGAETDALSVNPSALQGIGSVSPRYQSYNVEMIEVTGGK
jgi:hypothetical protein